MPSLTWGQENISDPFAIEDPSLREEFGENARSISQELSLDFSYVGPSEMKQGNARFGQVDEIATSLQYVLSPQIDDHFLLRTGVDWTRFSFGLPSGAPIPNTFQNYSLILGFDWMLSEQWLMRFDLLPGIYNTSHDIRSEDINMPAVLGFSYLQGPDLQWIFGLRVDPFFQYPVLPAFGLRWKFADQWVLNLIPPRPRIEYEITPEWTAFAGLDLRGGAYRSDKNFGSSHGNDKLNSTPVSYFEVRTGAGFAWKLTPAMKLDLSGGWVPLRGMGFHRAKTNFRTENGSPYVQLSLQGRF